MKLRQLTLLTAFIAAASAAQASPIELITNGGFENGFLGWTHSATTLSLFNGSTAANINGGSISQQVLGSIQNGTYSLSFTTDLYASDSLQAGLYYRNAHFVGPVIYEWVQFAGNDNNEVSGSQRVTYTATVADAPAGSVLELKFNYSGFAGTGRIHHIDDVSLTFEPTVASAVPEPETYSMMFCGIGAFALAAIRRKKITARQLGTSNYQ